MNHYETRLYLYSSGLPLLLLFLVIISAVIKSFNSISLYIVFDSILLLLVFDVLICFFKTESNFKYNLLAVLSVGLAFADMLTTIVGVNFNMDSFNQKEGNWLLINLLSEKALFLSICYAVLFKLLIHISIITSSKVILVFFRNNAMPFKKLDDYKFREYFSYSRSIRQIFEPIEFLKNTRNYQLFRDQAFALYSASRAEIVVFSMLYFGVIFNNICAIIVYKGLVSLSTRNLLKASVYAYFIVLTIVSPLYIYSNTIRRIQKANAKQVR